MTTILELIDTAPASTDGLPIDWDDAGGGWRGVFQIADPLAGSAVEWFDLSEYLLGYNLTKGAATYAGRPEATVANIELMADAGLLAPTNPDTSALFGDHIDLGPGLLARFSLIRVAGGVVVEWLPRFTLKVEYWGNAAHARGRIRRHLIVARDTFTSLVDVPVAAADPQDWSDKVVHITTGASWQYGILAYHDFDLLLPERDEQDSSVRELDAALDPAGLVWFTDRYGHLYIRPRPGDTLHVGAGYSLPTVTFHYQATSLTSGLIAYAVDYDAIEPFGLAKSETGVKNRLVITSPGGTFDQDDPTSIERFDPKVYRATWIADNDQAAIDMLAYRAYAEMEATPLYTCIGQPGFHDLLLADYLYPAVIDHTASVLEEVTSATGVVRRLEESAVFAGPAVDMSIRTTLDIETFSTVEGLILPVEDLALDALGDTGAVFSWTNPTQVVTPTHTQVRMIGVTAIWITYPYPITGLSWGGLDPNTGYQFQVRLVEITDGIVTAASAIRVLNFTTTFTQPVVDDDDVTFPPPECGSLDWELQESDDGTTWTIIDDGTISSPPFTLDLSLFTFDPTKSYRFRMDACGDTFYSSPFVGACTDPPALATAPYDDANLVAYWPAICPPDTIVEAISETPASHGPNYDLFVLDGDLNIVLVADGEGTVAYGQVPTAVASLTGDATISARVNLASQPDDPVTLFGLAGLWIDAIPEGANWAVRARCHESGSGITTLTPGTLGLAFGSWIDVVVTHDVSPGDLRLYVDGVQVASALGSVGARHDYDVTDQFQIGLSDNGLITNCAMWDRVLDVTEIPGATPFTPEASTLFKHIWWAGGPAFQALGIANGASTQFIPDEMHAATGSGSSELAMATSSRRPIYRSSVASLNNQPAWEFDASNDMIQHNGAINATGGNPGTTALPYTLIVVAQLDTVASSRYLTDSIGVGGTRLIIGIGASSSVWRLYAGSDTTGGSTSTGSHAFRAYLTSSTDTLTADGSTIITGTAGGATFDGITLGADYTGGANHDGHIAFVGLAVGDATAHADWSSFVSWVASTYSKTIS